MSGTIDSVSLEDLQKFIKLEQKLATKAFIVQPLSAKVPMVKLSQKNMLGARPVNRSSRNEAWRLWDLAQQQGIKGPYSFCQVRLDPSHNLNRLHAYGLRIQFAGVAEEMVLVSRKTAQFVSMLPHNCKSYASYTPYAGCLGYAVLPKPDTFYSRFHLVFLTENTHLAISVRIPPILSLTQSWPTDIDYKGPRYGLFVAEG